MRLIHFFIVSLFCTERASLASLICGAKEQTLVYH